MQSPRLGFLTHSQIVGIANEEEDLVYSRSNLHNPLQSVEEISEEQTPVCTPLQSVRNPMEVGSQGSQPGSNP